MRDPSTDGPDDVTLLISGYGERLGGGLFLVTGGEVEVLDQIGTTGLALGDGVLGRLVRSSPDFDAVAELLVYDTLGVALYRRLDWLADPHDLLADGSGGWLTVSSASGELSRIPATGRPELVWAASSVEDSWHPNCVTEVDGDLWISAFGEFSESREWSGPAAWGAGFLRNLTTGETLGGLSHPHSPRYVDGRWWACNSLAGTVVRRTSLGEWEAVIDLEHYPRGLAFVADHMYVGLSSVRGSNEGSGAVAVVRDGSVVRTIPLPCDEVYEVLELHPDLAAGVRRGFATNPHRAAEQVGALFGKVVGGELLGQPLDPAVVSTSVTAAPPVRLHAGVEQTIEVSVTNHGAIAHASVPPFPVYLASRWTSPSGEWVDGPRARLGRILDPGGSAAIDLRVSPPADEGAYTLTIALVQEGVCWFDELHPENGTSFAVEVLASDGPPPG